ncbi:MAG: phosphoglycerate dehydrogenase [Candidatus Omnitrophica bacterium]|nr:phosphoglycerate dehydrogenase [Candidatus Omnitrophota bacterium]MBU1997294.1 phosphoglycerate dehydrogenase [Candidatus Omnitrophota bacterium]
MKKILISDKLADECIEILRKEKEFQVDVNTGLKPDELKAIIKDYDAIIIRSATKLKEDILDAADNLKFIGRAGVGLDNVDLKAATKKGIVAMNTPAGNTTSTAEQTMALILALSRNTAQACASLKSGKWERTKFDGVELYGKTLGIIGLGRIGSTVASFAKAFVMNVIAYDPFLSIEAATKKGVEIVDLEKLLKTSDFISVHIPKSSETKDLIGDKEFDIMKKTCRVINCARGGIVNESALIRALEQGKIAGCAVDVYEQEPPDFNSPLFKFENCVTTPHLGASTSEAQINVAIEIAETVKNALLGRGIVNAANFPTVSAEGYKVLEPYINLGLKMGKFAGQLINGRINEVKITYSGVVTDHKVTPVTLSLVHGLLSHILGDTINSINALEVAKDRSIAVEEVNSTKDEEFVNCIIAEIKTDKDPFVLWGTLSGNNQPRIVKVNNVYVEAVPDGNLLFINNNDKPGIVGAVGTVLAQENVNIAGITFGRESKGGLAVSVVNVDSEVSEETIKKIKNTKDVLFVKLLKI